MAVFTEVDNKELEEFWSGYHLGEILSINGIAEGVENSNFFIQTTDKRYILTLFEKRVKPEDLPYFVGLMDHVSQQGFSCPQPMFPHTANPIGSLSNRPALVTSFLHGLSVKKPTVSDCHMLGQALAQFHGAASGFKMHRPNNLSYPSWVEMYQHLEEKLLKHDPAGASLCQQALLRLSQEWPGGLPYGHIHADLFPDNVFFRQGQVSGFIDFYFACQDMLAYDIAICINAWCFEPDGSLNVTKSSSLLSGYQTVRSLENAEREALGLLCLGSSLRFYLTRAHDLIHHDPNWLVTPKNPHDYILRMRTHLRANGASGYGLWS